MGLVKKFFRKKPLVVELGNRGLGWPGEKTADWTVRFAKKAKWAKVQGIDLRKTKFWDRIRFPRNLKQKTADFLKGIEKMQDNSVSRIYSRMSLGYYNAAGRQNSGSQRSKAETVSYTAKVLNAAHRKLKQDGKIILTVGEEAAEIIKEALEKTPFQKKTKIFELRPSEWKNPKRYRIIAQK